MAESDEDSGEESEWVPERVVAEVESPTAKVDARGAREKVAEPVAKDAAAGLSIDELLGLAPGSADGDEKSLLPLAKRQRREQGDASKVSGECGDDGDCDARAVLPAQAEPSPLPPGVEVVAFSVRAHFSMRCKVDLKEICFGIRNAEYNPRANSRCTVRLISKHLGKGTGSPTPIAATAAIYHNGGVRLDLTSGDEASIRPLARRLARMVQKCGHPEAQCHDLRIIHMKCKADLLFPVRLDRLADRWSHHTLYEPDISSKLAFHIERPCCTLQVASTGKVWLVGCTMLADAQLALRRAYPIFREFSH